MKEQENALDGSGAVGLCNIAALPLQLPLRLRVGKNVLDHNAAIALVFVVLYAGLAVSIPVGIVAAVYFIALLCHRVATLRRWMRGEEGHSRYNGYPVFGKLLGGKFDEVAVKATVEPLFAVALGILSAPFGETSMMFFFICAGCMFASTLLTEMRHRQRLDAMRDATIEGDLYRPGRRKGQWRR